MIKRDLYKRLERLETRALVAADAAGIRLVFVNDGTPGGLTCVRGPDGRHVWWNPPEGCKVGDLPEDRDKPASRLFPARVPCGMRVIFVAARDGREAGPTTVIGPDGRLVWREPPEGCKEGELIEDSAGDPGPTALHIYSRPFDICEVYDLKAKQYAHVKLSNVSEFGVLTSDLTLEKVALPSCHS